MNNLCKRCGECCRHSSPALHFEDIELILRGILSIRDILTLRKGQRVFDNIHRKASYLDEEIVRIKEKPDSRGCIFFDPLSSSCSIYDHRPLQCRVFFCERPEPLKRLFKVRKPSRADIVKDPEMIKIMDAHSNRVDMGSFVSRVEAQKGEIDADLTEMILYDLHFRDFIQENMGIPREELSFYFGIPLTEILKDYGLKLAIRT